MLQRTQIQSKIDAYSNLKPIFGALRSIAGTTRRSVDVRRNSAKIYEKTIHSIFAQVLIYIAMEYKAEHQVQPDSSIDNDGFESSNDEEEAPGKQKNNPLGLIIITSDRGLGGSYNKSVFESSESFIAKNQDKDIKLMILGLRGQRHFKQHGNDIILRERVPLNGHIYYLDAHRLARQITSLYIENHFQEIHIICNFPTPHGTFEVRNDRYLPPVLPEASSGEKPFEWDPVSEIDPSELVKYLIPEYLAITLYHYLLEAMFAEQTARFQAMDAASRNTDERIAELTRAAQQARQMEVTTETLEVSAGAEASK